MNNWCAYVPNFKYSSVNMLLLKLGSDLRYGQNTKWISTMWNTPPNGVGWGGEIYLRFLKNNNLKCKSHTNSHKSKILKKSKKLKKFSEAYVSQSFLSQTFPPNKSNFRGIFVIWPCFKLLNCFKYVYIYMHIYIYIYYIYNIYVIYIYIYIYIYVYI